jgi:hypothetical protein
VIAGKRSGTQLDSVVVEAFVAQVGELLEGHVAASQLGGVDLS